MDKNSKPNKPAKKPRTFQFEIYNNNDPNDNFTVSASSYEEANRKALLEVGWWVAENERFDKHDKSKRKA
jgi:hypothetical protein